MVSTCYTAQPKAGTGAGDGVEARFDTALRNLQLRLFGRLCTTRKAASDSPDQGKLLKIRTAKGRPDAEKATTAPPFS